MEMHHRTKRMTITSGFSLVEALLSISLFAISVTFLVGAIVYGQSVIQTSTQRARASFLAEEGLEALRNMRDASFSNLTDGTFGVGVIGNQWALSGAQDVNGIFTRRVTIAPIDAYTKQITSVVTWTQNLQRNGTSTAVTYLTDWQRAGGTQASFTAANASNAALTNGGQNLTGITLRNTGSSTTTLDKVTASWSLLGIRRIQQVVIGGVTVWSSSGVGTPTGTQGSGTTLDIVNVSLPPGQTVSVDYLQFNVNMTLSAYSITFTFSDGSTTTTATGILL